MVEAKTIGIGALIIIFSSLTFWSGTQLNDDNAYYCEATNTVMVCDHLSSTMKTCYGADGKGKQCSSVWEEIIDDVVINEEVRFNYYQCWSDRCEAVQ